MPWRTTMPSFVAHQICIKTHGAKCRRQKVAPVAGTGLYKLSVHTSANHTSKTNITPGDESNEIWYDIDSQTTWDTNKNRKRLNNHNTTTYSSNDKYGINKQITFNLPVESGGRQQESRPGKTSRPHSTRFPFEGPRGKWIRELLLKEVVGILGPRAWRNRSTKASELPHLARAKINGKGVLPTPGCTVSFK